MPNKMTPEEIRAFPLVPGEIGTKAAQLLGVFTKSRRR